MRRTSPPPARYESGRGASMRESEKAFVGSTNRRTTGARVTRARKAVAVAASATSSIQAIADRIAERRHELARHMVERYRAEIVDYRTADEDFLDRDVYAVSLDNLELLLAGLSGDEPAPDDALEATRLSAARRIQQGISLDSFLHAARLWGQITWETVLEEARPDDPDEREAALHIAGHVLRHMDS